MLALTLPALMLAAGSAGPQCLGSGGSKVACSRSNQRCTAKPVDYPTYHILYVPALSTAALLQTEAQPIRLHTPTSSWRRAAEPLPDAAVMRSEQGPRWLRRNNDPNGLDARHGLYYHVMLREHIALENGGVGNGPVFGHIVSHDLTHWARLNVSIWNDQPYDDVAIYTGSTTIVNGTPTIVYPGLCAPKPSWPHCDGSQDQCHLAVAVPTNDSGPLCREWH